MVLFNYCETVLCPKRFFFWENKTSKQKILTFIMVTIRCFVAIKRNDILIIQSLDKQTFPASFTTSVFQSGGNSKKHFLAHPSE